MLGRHPDVDDRHVRLLGLDELEQPVGVPRLTGDLEAAVCEEPGEPLAKQK